MPAEEFADQLAIVRQLKEQTRILKEENDALKGGGGGGTSGTMDTAIIDAKIAASEARADTKFSQVLGKLEGMDGKLTRIEADNIRTRSTVRTSAIALGALFVSIAALLVAAISSSFNIGAKVGDVARTEARQTYNDLQPRPVQPIPVPQSNPKVPQPTK